jgi:hypothetical protein
MHFFEHPDHSDVLSVLFKIFPRKIHEQICWSSDENLSRGWDLQFVEGVDYLAVFLCGCVGFMLCSFAAIVWSVVARDVQSGFAIGGFLLTFILFCFGGLYTAILQLHV